MLYYGYSRNLKTPILITKALTVLKVPYCHCCHSPKREAPSFEEFRKPLERFVNLRMRAQVRVLSGLGFRAEGPNP